MATTAARLSYTPTSHRPQSTGLACIGDFFLLAARLDSKGRWDTWVQRSPVLAAVGGASQLLHWRDQHTSLQSDSVLAALVWWASREGGDDCEALLMVLHLLAPGVARLSGKMRRWCSTEAESLVVGELTVQIRQFPWRRRTRAIAANLLLDTQAGLLREWCPYRKVGQTRVWEVPCDPLTVAQAWADHKVQQGTHHDSGPPLGAVIAWARRRGLIDTHQAEVLHGLSAEPLQVASFQRSRASHQRGDCGRTQPLNQPKLDNPRADNRRRGKEWGGGEPTDCTSPRSEQVVAHQRPEVRLALKAGVSVRTIERRKASALKVIRQARWLFLAHYVG